MPKSRFTSVSISKQIYINKNGDISIIVSYKEADRSFKRIYYPIEREMTNGAETKILKVPKYLKDYLDNIIATDVIYERAQMFFIDRDWYFRWVDVDSKDAKELVEWAKEKKTAFRHMLDIEIPF